MSERSEMYAKLAVSITAEEMIEAIEEMIEEVGKPEEHKGEGTK